ncbi:MAG: hypothetical protein EBW05_10770 [Betaproteobacteria bacterium]|nr:hypothetical protein [Betaproteobacteria bacterium]
MRRKSTAPRVLSVDWDGLFVSVEFTTKTGERVSAAFRFERWVQPRVVLDCRPIDKKFGPVKY